jgi:VacB/RNase II family 3'-5' exoribonuclease
MAEHTFDLAALAVAEMIRQGFHPGFPAGCDEQVASIRAATKTNLATNEPDVRDLRQLLWSSIDNDTSRDLDQVEYAERVEGGIRLLVAIADVSHAVTKGTPLDAHAADQTTTIYTAVRNFPMLPNELSTDLTSLNQSQDRAAIVTEYLVDTNGAISKTGIYRAVVRNQAQLAYSKVGPWLKGTGSADAKVQASADLQQQLKLQDEAAQLLHTARVKLGALEFNKIEADPIVVDGKVVGLKADIPNRATSLIEELMVAANETMASTLRATNRSAIQRIVRSPERWARIVELVGQHGTKLPATPDPVALNSFLQAQRASDPAHYPDLALAVIKLMGPGEYVLVPGDAAENAGHFGLAAHDYSHSTAPNRRFPDLVTQRVVKALIANEPPPYTDAELATIAQHCVERESAARKVQRSMIKRVAAVALAGDIGKTFKGVITGASPKGVYVRVFDPPVEGRIIRGEQGLDVGDCISVTLLHTDPVHAFIDFARA